MTFHEVVLCGDRLSRLSCRAQVVRAASDLGHVTRRKLKSRAEGSMLANELGVFVPTRWRALFVRTFKRAALVAEDRGRMYPVALDSSARRVTA